MAYSSLRSCVDDLEKNGHLVRISEEMDPELEMAEIHRRVFQAEGPALYFERVKGSPFPAVSNMFGTMDRVRFMFRDTMEAVQKAVRLKADPTEALRDPFEFIGTPWTGLTSLPMKVGSPTVLKHTTTLDQLPQIRSWPMDGGAYVLLPQVLTEDPDNPGPMGTNVGMYRVQLSGNELDGTNAALHYQIHRGIGVHHTAALRRGEPLRVSIHVGGPPAHTFGAVMPLPEGLSELIFAGMLGGRRFRWGRAGEHFVSSDADFVIVGTVDTELTPEGPFGDHLGYYSLTHDFPLMKVEAVYHRPDPIWPFTIVGRPPQEDSYFGALIGELVRPMVPVSLPGVQKTHAVDVAGVHPLLLAIGSERYVPYGATRTPQEILTQANAILGFNQASLAKYLMITAIQDAPDLDIHDLRGFFGHVLSRLDLRRDLHFQTKTTIDTLDYSGTGLNEGSKVVLAAAGPPIRTLGTESPIEAKVVLPGVLVLEGQTAQVVERLEAHPAFRGQDTPWPLVVVVDDLDEVRRFEDFLWVAFTRSNPSHDLFGVHATFEHKHWGCDGSLVIDARVKPHHAPPLVEDPKVTARVDQLFAKGGPLHGII